MNGSRLIFCLSLSAVALLAANWQVRLRGHRAASAPGSAAEDRSMASGAPPSGHTASTSNPALLSSSSPGERRIQGGVASQAQRRFSFDWSAVETTDYRRYADNLRAIGLPEELVRSIVIADIEEHYAAARKGLQRQPAIHDASWTEREGTYQTNEWERVAQMRELQIEQQEAIKDVLGIYVERPIVRTPRSQNYEAYEYAISQLPEDKRLAVQAIVEEEIIRDGKNHDRPLSGGDAVEAYRVSAAQRDAALKQVLTPEEFEFYERSTTPCGTELARQILGMEPTDQEFATMFRLGYKCWQDSGGVYGWWRALPVPPEQIDAAQEQLQRDLETALGPERYLDYQMAASDTGQQLKSLAARYDLPRDALTRAFDLQRQIDWLDKGPASLRQVGNGLIPPPTSPTEQPREALEQQLQQVLGATAWQAWQEGRNRQLSFDPVNFR